MTQWRKALGLLSRNDWSAAIVRSVTAAEISLNLALRAEYGKAGELGAEEIDQRLMTANGVSGKISLLREIENQQLRTLAADLKSVIRDTAKKRNRIVHSGEFCDEIEAREHAQKCRVFVNRLIGRYEPGFLLSDEELAPRDDPGA